VSELNVLVWDPDPAIFGGHTVQLDMTARYVDALPGVSVRVVRGEGPDFTGVDIVHGFGLQSRHIREARVLGIPICLSVIYWAKDYRIGLLVRRGRVQTASSRTRAAASLALAAARGRHIPKCESFSEFAIRHMAMYEAVDLLLPNSQLEADDLVGDLNVTTPIHVVPNAVDPALYPPGLPWDERRGVVYVARLEPRKNQLGLIEALRGTGVPLTIVGGDHPHHPEYAAKVRAEAGGDVEVLGHASHEQLVECYARARVHAIPSEFETTGLVSLEAAMCGCNIVTTELGYAREYFEDLAWYCRPEDRESIRTAVLEALGSPPRDALRTRILERYTWEHTADATVAGYREVLALRR
jgi:glycosyltransferase involved in cell wall biosynthesis